MEEIQFNHTLPIQLRFNDVDKFGHVNNTVYFSFYDLGKTEYFAPDDFMLRSPRSSNTVSEKDKYNLERMEKDAINEVMRMCGGNITLAAEMLGITRTSLYRRIEKFRL